MNRLTTIPQASLIECCGCPEESNCYGDIACNQVDKAIEKLKQYEDTEVSPEEILEAKNAIKMFYEDFPNNIGKATNVFPLSFFKGKDDNDI